MFPILEAEFLAPEIKRFVIEAPRIARKRQASQVVIIRVHARGERIPLALADGDPERGTITLIVQGVGKTTKLPQPTRPRRCHPRPRRPARQALRGPPLRHRRRHRQDGHGR